MFRSYFEKYPDLKIGYLRGLEAVDETYVAAHFGKWHILGDPGDGI